MGTTLLAKKANGENPVATDDDHHEALASDPSVTSFPEGSTMADISTGFGGGFGSATSNVSSSGSSAFGSTSTSGFGGGGFGATTAT